MAMGHRERLFNTIERKPVDFPASWLGIPTETAMPGLLKYFNVNSLTELKKKLGDDLFVVDIPYHSPYSNHVAFAFDFSKQVNTKAEERTLTERGYFANLTDPRQIADFPWPNPTDHIDPEECRRRMDEIPEEYPVMVAAWSIHYEATCAAFGMEDALITMLERPELFSGVMQRITDFFLQANEIFYRAVGDRLDMVLIGNDLGTQRSLIIGPDQIRQHVLPGTKALVDQAHAFGYKVMHHSCGAISEIIPDLIDIGVDAIHPIQALAAHMSAEELQQKFADQVSFCGGVDAQSLLVRGTPDEVRACVGKLKKLFPTGIILSPSHEAILPDISPANIEALFAAVREA